ncbi:helix-turn-helix domain-containing protein [Microbacterium kunmingense]|jgi:excisionase family DNA binding protein|uniref:helix-turn-helix domain-containing protein n=1 Tax=Microbacterium kunmingense TaxID=2915939 RepID=UPI002004C80C|nr:helix-turn-helix domain-containing protein [Microbacterium kunmingense]
MSDRPDAVDRLFEQCPPTLGTTEVAERLGVSAKSVYGWLRDGLIPGYKIGTTWFVITDELKDTLRKGANTRRDTGPVVVIQQE